PEHIHAEIGEIINATKSGRSSHDEITFFKSCGVAVQDVVTASIALKNAERENLGKICIL
ncbi:MAG TPA: ornithine cyclodeaminase, partial [Deltaproteobacteria bacterium]|nr:ornithine cyclodeaminase [Deltaproteobacteria bacterium]